MRNEYRLLIDGLGPSKIKGTFTDLLSEGKFVKIKKIYTFQSLRKNLPFVYLEGKKERFIGIILARQSSDFLVRLFQKKVHSAPAGIKLIQYRFPNDMNSLKLIAFLKWKKISDFELFTINLQNLQTEFIKNLDGLLI